MLKEGDMVVMHTCGEAEHYTGKIWTCRSDEFKSTSGSQVVFLEGFSGYFLTKYLQYVNLTQIEPQNIISKALHVFPKSFINNSNEIILEPRNNVYFRLEDVNCDLDFKCKMFAWVSRPIAKSLNKYWYPRVLKSFNDLLGTNFTKDDMYEIYDRLGNDVNRQLTIKFIESSYDLSLLERN